MRRFSPVALCWLILYAAPLCFGAVTVVNLVTQVTGTLPVANGGTGAATFTIHGVLTGQTTGAFHATAAGTAGQLLASGGSSADPGWLDFPDVKIVPAANCVNTVAGGGWSYTTSNFTATCRAGTNNLNGVLNAIPSTGATGHFDFELAGDWDSGTKPYIAIFYGSGANTSGTVIFTISTSCTKNDGSVTDDPSWIAESAMGTQTMANANRMWSQSAQLAGAMTNCIKGGTIYFKVVLSGTASSAIQVSKAAITVPRQPVVQAN